MLRKIFKTDYLSNKHVTLLQIYLIILITLLSLYIQYMYMGMYNLGIQISTKVSFLVFSTSISFHITNPEPLPLSTCIYPGYGFAL